MQFPRLCPKCHSYELTYLMRDHPDLFQGHNFGWENTIECKSCDFGFFTTDEMLKSYRIGTQIQRYALEHPDKYVMEYLVELFVENTNTNYKRCIILNITDLKELLKLKLFSEPEFYPYIKAQIFYLEQTNPVIAEIAMSIDEAIPKLDTFVQDNFGYLVEDHQIKGIKLRNKRILFFPYQIIKLPNLQYLELCNLSMNYHDLKKGPQDIPLHTISEDIGHIKQLKYLNLENNKLRILPHTITSLENLSTLRLGNNEIEQLPSEFGNLKNLRELTIDSNPLTDLPDGFVNLKNLSSIKLDQSLFDIDSVKEVINRLKEIQLSKGTELQVVTV